MREETHCGTHCPNATPLATTRYYLFLDLGSVSQSDRPYLVLLNELWLQSPMVVKGGKRLELADVIRRRSEEVLTMYNDLGFKGSTFGPGAQAGNRPKHDRHYL